MLFPRLWIEQKASSTVQFWWLVLTSGWVPSRSPKKLNLNLLQVQTCKLGNLPNTGHNFLPVIDLLILPAKAQCTCTRKERKSLF